MAACEFGASPRDLDFVLSRTTPDWGDVVKAAAKGGHLHVFQWIRGQRDDRGPWEADLYLAISEAARYDHLELIKWLHERGVSSINRSALFTAVLYGHLAVLKWLYEHAADSVAAAAAVGEATGYAAGNGHLATVQWIYNHFKDTFHTARAMAGAARNGDIEMLEWLHQQKSCSEACNTSAFDAAVAGGHFHVVEWLYANCSEGYSSGAAEWAAANGDLPMLRWLHTHYTDRFTAAVMDTAAAEGHLAIVRWLHEHRSEGCTSLAMDQAASEGHLELVWWLYDNRTEGCTAGAMDGAAGNGYLDIVRWLHDNRSEGCTDKAANEATSNGHLDVLRWLVEHYPDKCRDDLMEVAGWKGHLDIVRYLDENTNQRASAWGLGAAARQGWLRALLVLLQNYPRYHKDENVDYDTVEDAIEKILTQMALEHATPASPLWAEALESLEGFRSCEFSLCAPLMLERALKRGFLPLVQQFMGGRDAEEKRNYLDVAAMSSNVVLLRWLLAKGTPIDKYSAKYLVSERSNVPYFEVVGYLSEGDRVELVCEAAAEKRHRLLRWTLENILFSDDSSRTTIYNAIKRAPSDTQQWLREHLTNPEARKWCLPRHKRQRVE
jgi:hypothetical protein